MKTSTSRNLTSFLSHILAGLCLALPLLAYNASAAVGVQFWDNNGPVAATSGTWDTTTTNWAASSSLGATASFSSGNYAAFAAGTIPINTVTITVPGSVTCAGI